MKTKGVIISQNKLNKESRAFRRITASHRLIIALAFVSIIGFAGIVSETLFDKDIGFYVEALWLIVIGIALTIEGKPLQLKNIKYQGLTPGNLTNLITVIIGVLSVVTGIFSIPGIRLEANGFLAVKGIISLIAIIVIIVQTWIVE